MSDRPVIRWLMVSRMRRKENISFHRIAQWTFRKLVSFGRALDSMPV